MRISDYIPDINSLCVFRQTQLAGNVFNNKNGRPHHALSLRVSGESRFASESGSFYSRSCSITYVPMNTPYVQNVIADSEIIVLHFTSSAKLSDKLASERLSDGCERTEIIEIFSEMFELYNSGSLESIARLYSDFYALLAKLLTLDSAHGSSSGLPEKTDEILRRNLSNPGFSVADAARELSVSESYLRKSFGRKYGISPRKRLVDLRIRRACDMLSSGYYNVSEVSVLCGFSSSSYFSRVFRAETGRTPTELLYPNVL